jgi:hypothetical protein
MVSMGTDQQGQINIVSTPSDFLFMQSRKKARGEGKTKRWSCQLCGVHAGWRVGAFKF